MAFDGLISRRIGWAHIALERYGFFSWSGQTIPMVGNGYSSVPPEDYFFIDSSYINVLLTKGALILFAALAALVKGSFAQKKQEAWERLWILVLVAIHCFMEQHLVEIAYNPFLFLLLASTSVDTEKAKIKLPFLNVRI